MTNLNAKLVSIMRGMKPLRKRGRNVEDGYSFVTEADTLSRVRKALVSEQVLLWSEVLNVIHTGVLTTIEMRFTFCDAETGEQRVFAWAGEAGDRRDKAIWKAITGAQKTFLLKTFLIPTHDDPERDSAEPALTVAPDASPVLITQVVTKGRTSMLTLSDGRKVVVFQPQLLSLAEQRSQDKIPVLVKCEGMWRGKPKCIEIHDANPKPQPESTVPSVAPKDAIL